MQLRVVDHDRYGRTVAEVYHQGQLINLEMVRGGFAYVYPQYVHQCDRAVYEQAEAQAAAKQLGVWIQSQAGQPWKFRRQR